MRNLTTILSVVLAVALVCGCLPEDEEVTLVSLSVTADVSEVPKGLTATLSAAGTYSDDSVSPCEVTWTSSDANTATVFATSGDSSQAIVTGLTQGEVTITAKAKADESILGTVVLEVTSPVIQSMVLSPAQGRQAVGLEFDFDAVGTYSDGTLGDAEVTWSVDDENVGTVDGNGTVTTLTEGTILVTAVSTADPDLHASAGLDVVGAVPVSLSVTPSPADVDAGLTVDFTATATYSDQSTGTIAVTWSSSDDGKATVDASGTATGVAEGQATITATAVEDPTLTADAVLTVNAASLVSIRITPGTADVTITKTTSFSAVGVYSDQSTQPQTVTWSSSDAGKATIDGSGVATGVSAGVVTITATATSDPTVSGTATLTVKNPFDHLYLNEGNGGNSILAVPYAGGTGTALFTGTIHPGTPGNTFDPPMFVSNVRGVCTSPDGSRIYFMSEYRHVVEYVFATQTTKLVHLNTTLFANKGWQSLAIDDSGILYTFNATTSNYGVYQIDLSQNVNQNYPGVASQFCTMSVTAPMDIEVYNGDVYVCHQGGVSKGSAGGSVGFFYSYSNAGSLGFLSSLEVDANGVFYVVDPTAKQVYQFEDKDSNGWILSGESKLYLDLSSSQNTPGLCEIALDSLGSLYVAELAGMSTPAQGIWRFSDNNSDGDMLDAGEGSLWTTTVLTNANGGGNMALK